MGSLLCVFLYSGQGGSWSWMCPKRPSRSQREPWEPEEGAGFSPPPNTRTPYPFSSLCRDGCSRPAWWGGGKRRGEAICLIMRITPRLIRPVKTSKDGSKTQDRLGCWGEASLRCLGVGKGIGLVGGQGVWAQEGRRVGRL